jgi:ABC-type nitrate/sulfonate/bicarbonate transport system substrate-binding protein
MKLVPDTISNPISRSRRSSHVQQEGLDVELELIFPVDKSYAALRDGTVDFVGGSAHSALAAFPQWQGAKLLCAQGQGMYWFLVMHKDLGGKRGDVSVVKGKSIGAAPWVDFGIRRLLIEAGIDLARDEVKSRRCRARSAPG